MELNIIPVLTLLCVIIVGSHAALTPELYWKEALPNVAMPKSIRNSLVDPGIDSFRRHLLTCCLWLDSKSIHNEWMDNKGTAVNVGKGGVHVNNGKSGGGATHVDVGHKSGVVVSTGKPGGGHTDVNVGPKGGVRVSTGKPYKSSPTVGVGKGGVIVHAGPKKKPVYVGVKPGNDPFKYIYAASETQLHDDPTRALFFLEKDMKPGHKMNLHFTQSTNGATFLSREEAQAVPFSTNKMTDILNEFSVKPGSEEAQTIEQTVKECESKGIQGEQKYCATSLEGMVDYAKSTLGKNVKAISTEATNRDNNGQMYTIGAVRGVATDDNVAVCHKQNYAYAVFYCHKTKGTSPYVVTLISDDGVKNKAVAICHKNTSGWNPKHLAFQVLNVKPGSVPICHFLPEDHIVWVRN